jgi:hypothetical protein
MEPCVLMPNFDIQFAGCLWQYSVHYTIQVRIVLEKTDSLLIWPRNRPSYHTLAFALAQLTDRGFVV